MIENETLEEDNDEEEEDEDDENEEQIDRIIGFTFKDIDENLEDSN